MGKTPISGTLSEWLRRKTRMRMFLHQPRYLLGSARAGSSPAGVDLFIFYYLGAYNESGFRLYQSNYS